MSANCGRAIGIAAVLLAVGLIDAAHHVARADDKEDFKKSCVSGQLAAAENQKLNSATIIRTKVKSNFRCSRVVLLAAAVPASYPDLQKKMNAVGEACWSCIANPPCADE